MKNNKQETKQQQELAKEIKAEQEQIMKEFNEKLEQEKAQAKAFKKVLPNVDDDDIVYAMYCIAKNLDELFTQKEIDRFVLAKTLISINDLAKETMELSNTNKRISEMKGKMEGK